MPAVCIQLLFASLCITSVWAKFPDGVTWETAHCGKKYISPPLCHYFPLHFPGVPASAKFVACLFRFRIATHSSPPFTVEFPRVLCVLSFFHGWQRGRAREGDQSVRCCYTDAESYTACTKLTLLLICVVGHLAINPGSLDC